jgi:hypothetical protein
MNRFLLVIIILTAVSLFAQFDDAVRINEDLNSVYSRGPEACKIIGDGVCYTFIRHYPNELYFSISEDGISFENTILDEDVYCGLQALPTLEVLLTGKILIYYVKLIDDSFLLFQAVSIDNGISFDTEIIASGVTEFSTFLDGEELYLIYSQGSEHSFTYYSYFSNTEESENADGGFSAAVMPFNGHDEFESYVHSNSDIYIGFEGGPNGGWPIFHELVTTAGRLRTISGAPIANSCPVDQIFLGGYEENVSPVNLPSNADILQANSQSIGDGYDLVYVKLDGDVANTMYGQFIDNGTQQFDVYSWYPHNTTTANSKIITGNNWFEETDLVYQNDITILDTVWTIGPTFALAGNSFWVEDANLWIEGIVEGNTSWGCANNVYIVGDITYANTIPGEDPDDPATPNATDYFGLVSEQSIIVKYKHEDPFNNFELRSDNCEDVMIYGALAAIGFGDESVYGLYACHYDGMFTFEYQHPHGSTPNYHANSPYTQEDTTYSFIDFHKYIFPINTFISPELHGFNLHGNDPNNYGIPSGFPFESEEYINSYPNNDPQNYAYPYCTDYPWYNPVWPESADDIVCYRGLVKLWGSVIQMRRGFMKRSGYDEYNHPGESSQFYNIWDLENYHYGGRHPSTGYYKDYHYDTRFIDTQPVNFITGVNCNFNQVLIVTRSDNEGNTFETLTSIDLDSYEHISSIQAEAELIVISTVKNDSLRIHLSNNHGIEFSNIELITSPGKYRKMEISNDLIYFFITNTDTVEVNYVDEFNPATQLINSFTFSPSEYVSDFAISHNQKKVYVYHVYSSWDQNDFEFRYTEDIGSNFNLNYYIETSIYHSPPLFDQDLSHLFLTFDEQDYVYLNFQEKSTNGNYGNLWLVKGYLPDLTGTEEYQIPEPKKITLTNYPNPFNPTTTISLSLTTEITENTELVIYNLKGQKVKSFPVILSPETLLGKGSNGQHTIIWNGTDNNNKPVGTGIYFCKLKVDGKNKLTRKMLLLK